MAHPVYYNIPYIFLTIISSCKFYTDYYVSNIWKILLICYYLCNYTFYTNCIKIYFSFQHVQKCFYFTVFLIVFHIVIFFLWYKSTFLLNRFLSKLFIILFTILLTFNFYAISVFQ